MAVPPGPEQSSLVQTVHWVRRPIQLLEECQRRFGDTFTLRLLQAPEVVVLSDPDAIKKLFTSDPASLHAGEAAEILRPLLGRHSLLLLDGPEHLRQRRLMLPPFHGARMKAYAEAMREATEADLVNWPIGQPLSIHPRFQQITLEVILRTVFGVDDLESMRLLGAQLARTMALGQKPSILLSLLPVAVGRRAEFERQKAQADRMIFDEIARRRSKPDGERDDVMTLLLNAVDDEGRPMSDEELRDELITLLAAGHETTATSLAWTVERVLSRREVYERLRAEIESVLGGDPVTDAHLGRLEYLNAVVTESLRLRPVIPMVVRKLQVPAMVRGFELPAGTIVAPNIYLTHRREEIYPEPEQFRPERFVGVKPSPYAWLPFGGSIRRCLGMSFALYEMKIVLATVIQRVELGLAAGTSARMSRRAVTFAPSDGPRLVVRERRAPN